MKPVFGLIILYVLSSQLHAQVSFPFSATLSVGSGSVAVVTADVNGDGKPDLISANYGNGTLTVLTNDGSGRFVLSSTLTVGNTPYFSGAVCAADVNGDGWVDLICANFLDNTLTVLTNNRSGGFVLSSTLAVGTGPYGVIAADVNGDGKLDLISVNRDANSLTVLTNNGSGGFVLSSTISVGNKPFYVCAADVNRDGNMDLICVNDADNSLTVLTNNGSGGFVTSGTYGVGNGPQNVIAVDVNGDGWVDLVCANYYSNSLTVFTNNRSGGFVLSATLDVGPATTFVCAADVNGDGWMDLISANSANNTLTVLTNNGSGGFVTAATLNVGNYPIGICATDVNRDGKVDLICVNWDANTLTVLTNATPFPSPSFLTNGLVAYYPFDGNANDASGNGNNGNLQTGIGFGADRFGNPKSALFFTNGVAGEMTTTVLQPAANDFTIAMWFNLPVNYTNAGDLYLMCLTDTQTGPWSEIDKAIQVGGHGPTNDLFFYLFPGFGIYLPTPNPESDGRWHHAVATLSSLGMMLYLDGNLVATNANTSSEGYAGYWRIFPGQGSVDDVRVYNLALSSNVIRQLYAYELEEAINPPSITGEPQSLVVYANNTASFSVTAIAAVPLNYQWSLNGGNISGATASTLTISNVVQTNLGTYAVVVSSAYGTSTSSNAVLLMFPFLAVPFDGVVVNWGQNAVLSVGAWGTGPLSYQWFDNGAAILDATNQTLDLSSIQFTNAGLYSVVVRSPLGSLTNTPEQVVVNPSGLSLGLSPTLTISGTTGYSYLIQSTTNLADTNSWVTLTNLTLIQPIQIWVDTNTDASLPANPYHYYRVLPGQ